MKNMKKKKSKKLAKRTRALKKLKVIMTRWKSERSEGWNSVDAGFGYRLQLIEETINQALEQ